MNTELENYVENYACTECDYMLGIREDLLPCGIFMDRLVHGAVGCATELQELETPVSNLLWMDGPVFGTMRHNMVEELGDLLWFACLSLQAVYPEEESTQALLKALRKAAKEALLTGSYAAEQLRHALRVNTVLLDYLKSLMFYNSSELKNYEVKKLAKGSTPANTVEVLRDVTHSLLQESVSLVAALFPRLSHGSLESCMIEVLQKNLAKLQARHKGKAISDNRDYDKEKQAMESVDTSY